MTFQNVIKEMKSTWKKSEAKLVHQTINN